MLAPARKPPKVITPATKGLTIDGAAQQLGVAARLTAGSRQAADVAQHAAQLCLWHGLLLHGQGRSNGGLP